MSATVILVGIVMILALIGMIACAKKQRTNPNAQPIAIALLIVVIACGVTIMFKTGSLGDGDAAAIIENETRFACAKAEILGDHLKKKCAGEKTLIVADRDFEKNERTKRLIEALKKGLGTPDAEVCTIEIANKGNMPAEEEFMMPIEEMMTAKDFDKLIDSHSDCKLIVSMIGLPRDLAKMKLWHMSKDKRPNLALLNADTHALKGAIAKGLITAVVSYKPGITYTEESAPSDPQKAFDMRYLLITPENVEKVAKDNKGLFQ